MNSGYLARPFEGETVCGDAGAIWQRPSRRIMALADGLGHGPAAHHAAMCAMQCIEDSIEHSTKHSIERSCAELFAACDARLLLTRGAALAIAIIDQARDVVTLASIGNIRAVLLTQHGDFRLGGGRGIVGAGYTWMPPDQMPLAAGDTLVMFSDGVDELADVRACLNRYDVTPQTLAEDILARWGQRSDDASVLVYRHDNGGAAC